MVQNSLSSAASAAKYRAYVINLNEYILLGIYWTALYMNGDDVTFFDNFGVENNPEEIKKFITSNNLWTFLYCMY